VPSSEKAHWQARIHWRSIYDLVHPYLSTFACLSGDATLPPTSEEIADSLDDSEVNVRIEFNGLQVRHTGPIPFGAAYVPGVTIASLSASADPSSESARERVACRHLRVLYHHARLFKKDYGRWPATVAELDGYVDFAIHPYLLRLRPQERSLAENFVAVFTGEREHQSGDEEEEWEAIDDSLYVIDWTPEDWKLKFRDDQFKEYQTIYIDTEGNIHRVPKTKQTGDSRKDEEVTSL
jgi:hypothetical protein